MLFALFAKLCKIMFYVKDRLQLASNVTVFACCCFHVSTTLWLWSIPLAFSLPCSSSKYGLQEQRGSQACTPPHTPNPSSLWRKHTSRMLWGFDTVSKRCHKLSQWGATEALSCFGYDVLSNMFSKHPHIDRHPHHPIIFHSDSALCVPGV